MAVGAVIGGIAAAGPVVSGVVGPAQARSRAGNNAIRSDMIRTADAAVRAGQRTITVVTPDNITETGDPRNRLVRWAGLGGPEGQVGVGMPRDSANEAKAALSGLVRDGFLTPPPEYAYKSRNDGTGSLVTVGAGVFGGGFGGLVPLALIGLVGFLLFRRFGKG